MSDGRTKGKMRCEEAAAPVIGREPFDSFNLGRCLPFSSLPARRFTSYRQPEFGLSTSTLSWHHGELTSPGTSLGLAWPTCCKPLATTPKMRSTPTTTQSLDRTLSSSGDPPETQPTRDAFHSRPLTTLSNGRLADSGQYQDRASPGAAPARSRLA